MDLVTGAMRSLASKLLQLLQDEYNLHKGLRAEVESLAMELESTHVALSMVDIHELDPQVRLWALDVREASYDMEDILDTFLVHVDHQPASTSKGSKVQRIRSLLDKMGKLLISLTKLKAHHDIASAIEDIKKKVDGIAKLRDRYMTKDLLANNRAAATSIDRRLFTPDTRALELVKIDEPRDSIIKMLFQGDNTTGEKMKIVSIVGFGGLGKTTLAKAVFDKITVDMNISYTAAFVPVGQNPNFTKVFRDILLGLTGEYYMDQSNFTLLDELQLIHKIQKFLEKKRYFVVIDDIWEVSSWNVIKRALDDNNLGSKIIITTRRNDVANEVDCSYEVKPLSHKSSKLLFYGRIFDSRDKCPEQFSELSETILKKCAGVPLAVITIASLLANKSKDIAEWQKICDAIGRGLSTDDNMCNMRKILSLSYYDLPSHLKTCFLYLSIYPEDYEIKRDRLIWRWITEGFIQTQENGDDGLFSIGESYFNQLVNRSLVQPVCHIDNYGMTYGCRVHDMIVDLVCSLSREVNFVTILKDGKGMIPSGRSKVRRLSLKGNTAWPETGVSQVRSIAIFSPSVHHSFASIISCFNILRVLDLEGCRCNKLDFNVGKLIHLRYLGLAGTKLKELPGGIQKLRFLEVFKPGPCESPMAIFGLRHLMCLDRGKFNPRPGHLLGNLASLQVLNFLRVEGKGSVGAVEALRHLTQLRDLHIQINVNGAGQLEETIRKSFINSIGNLRQLRSLNVLYHTTNPSFWEHWVPSTHLRALSLFGGLFSIPKLPSWINPASVPLLSILHIDGVRRVLPVDIQTLGKLPFLCRLVLIVANKNVDLWPKERFTVSADAFPCLRWCRITNVVVVPSMFPHGAMPKVETLTFSLRSDFFSANVGLFNLEDLAMEHLPSLRRVDVGIYYYPDCDDDDIAENDDIAEKVKQALLHAACVHPNRPSITV